MDSFIISLLALLVTLGLLIAFHEYGHYWAARRSGVKVLRYCIGFGKPLWMRTRGEDKTEFVIAAFPIGGYVKMLDEREGEVAEHEVHRAFNRQKVSKRIFIVAAGPLFNFIFAIIAYFLMYLVGVPGMKPVVGEVSQDSIAYQAGLVNGDEIIQVGEEATPTWSAVRMSILEQGLDLDTLSISVRSTDGIRQTELNFQGVSLDEKQADLFKSLGLKPFQPIYPAVIGDMTDGKAAKKAGFEAGDRVLAVDGKSISDWNDWVEVIRKSPNKELQIEIERKTQIEVLLLKPELVETETGKVGYIGAAPQVSQDIIDSVRTVVKYPVGVALIKSVKETWRMSVLTLRMLGRMLTGEVSIKNLSGPITIATYAGYTASIGLTTFLSFLAIVSISLGVLNLLPIPILDGGHLLVYFIEVFTGKAVSDETLLKMQNVGIVILGMLMMLAFYNDIQRLLN